MIKYVVYECRDNKRVASKQKLKEFACVFDAMDFSFKHKETKLKWYEIRLENSES